VERKKVNPEQKVKSVKDVLEKGYTLREVAKRYNLHHSSVEKWVTLYQTFGEDGFYQIGNQHYSEEVKRKAVKKYLTTDYSLQDICREFQIRTISQVQKWIADNGKKVG